MSRECMLTVEELSRLDDLSARTLYSAEIKRIPIMPRDVQPQYVEAARNGDMAARNALIENCQNWLFKKAVLLTLTRDLHHSDLLDMISHANVTMLEASERALEARDPMKYLMGVGHREMQRWMYYFDPMIKKPKEIHEGYVHPQTFSGEAGEWPFFDHLKAPDIRLVSPETLEAESRERHAPLYDAIGELPEAWQMSLTTFCGLSDEPSGTAEDVAASLGVHEKTVERHVRYAKAELAQKLGQLAELPIARSEERPHYVSPNRQGSASGL